MKYNSFFFFWKNVDIEYIINMNYFDYIIYENDNIVYFLNFFSLNMQAIIFYDF